MLDSNELSVNDLKLDELESLNVTKWNALVDKIFDLPLTIFPKWSKSNIELSADSNNSIPPVTDPNKTQIYFADKKLKISGPVEIKADLHIINKSADANGNGLIIGPTDKSNLRLGYHNDYSWIQSHRGSSLAINPVGNKVGIGTTTPKQKLHISGDRGLLLLEGKKSAFIQFWPQKYNVGKNGNLGFTQPEKEDLFLSNGFKNGGILLIPGGDLTLKVKDGRKILIPSVTNKNIGQSPFQFKKYQFNQKGDNQLAQHPTNFDKKYWTAAIVGFSTGDTTDIGEYGKGTFLEVRMVVLPGSNNWHIHANAKTHDQKHAKWTINVLFIRNQFCQVEAGWGTPTISSPTTGRPNRPNTNNPNKHAN